METLGSPAVRPETFRSFDMLASVDKYRYDLMMFDGVIQAETRAQVLNEELSYIAEGINRPLFTEFNLQRRNGQLAYFYNGEWRPYLSTLERGERTAIQEAIADPRKQFAADRAEQDSRHGHQLEQLRPGQTMRWFSTFPGLEASRYGDKFVNEMGYQSHRRMGFLYRAECQADGSVLLQSHSVDSSDLEAFRAAMSAEDSVQAMRHAYDQQLAQKYGELFYAGRPQHTRLPEENAWTVVQCHRDLVDYYNNQIEKLAAAYELPRGELERAKKRLTYGVWAAIRQRLDNGIIERQRPPDSGVGVPFLEQAYLAQEVEAGYHELSAKGEILFGCGGALSGEEALLAASSESVFEALFSGSTSIMKCVKCPFCSKTVDAIKTKTHISCPKCKASAKL